MSQYVLVLYTFELTIASTVYIQVDNCDVRQRVRQRFREARALETLQENTYMSSISFGFFARSGEVHGTHHVCTRRILDPEDEISLEIVLEHLKESYDFSSLFAVFAQRQSELLHERIQALK